MFSFAKKNQTWLISLALFAVTLAVYWPARHFDFVNYDDPDYVMNNWLVQQGLTSKGIAWAFSGMHFALWQPLVWLSFMLDCQLFGPGPEGHHLVNIGFHAVNAVLLYVLLQEATGLRWRSAFVSALFALHPLRVESVVWITERKDVLSGFFFMLTLLAYLRHGKSRASYLPAPPPFFASRFYLLALTFFVLGLMTKAMLVTTPFLLLLLDFWPRQRLGPGRENNWRTLLFEKIPFMALAVVISAITYLTQVHLGTAKSLALDTRWYKMATTIPEYLEFFFWPTHLSVLYLDPASWPMGRVLFGAGLMALISLVVMAQWRTRPWLAVGWFWFVGMLGPVTGIVQVGEQFVASRFTYLPCIGLFIMVTWVASELLLSRWPRPGKILLTGVAAVILGLCVGATRAQLYVWQDSRSLWEQALRVDPNNYIAHNSLGVFLLSQGRSKAAEEEFQLAVKLNPKLVETWDNLGLIAMQDKDYGRAADLFQHALNINPKRPLSLANLGNALRMARDFTDAETILQKAQQLDPEFLPTQLTLGNLYDDLGKFDQAIPHYQKLLEYHPTDALSRCNLAIDLQAIGKLAEAVPQYQEALRLQPANASFHYYYSTALLASGRLGEGLVELRATLELDPKYLRALNDLSWLLATNPNDSVRNGREAVQRAELACQLTGGKDVRSLCSLDAAYAEAGRFPEAITTAEKAREVFLAMGATNFANKTEARIQLYRANKPFRN